MANPLLVYVSTDDIHTFLADIDERRDVVLRAENGTMITLRNASCADMETEESES